MNDPHVVSLEYSLETVHSTSYRNPPSVGVERAAFSARLADGRLTVTMKQHFSSAEAARAEIEHFLRAWELDVALRYGPGELQFVFKDSVVIDRNPPLPGQPQVVHLSGTAVCVATASTTLHVARAKYPEPPSRFRVTPDVETLWQRYEGYRAGREPLLSIAYFCYTLIQNRAGGRKQAALKFSIDELILRKLSELTSTRGDGTSARKFDDQSRLTPLSGNEQAWIEAAVKVLIRCVGEFDPDHPLPTLTMSDLPEL